jgi:type I restriction enzyme S subunit
VSKVNDLISELCPGGVEYAPITEVAKYIRGLTYAKDKESSTGGIRVLRSNNINQSQNVLDLSGVKTLDSSVKVKEHQKLWKDDILMSAASGSRLHVGKVAFIWEDMDYYFGGFMAVWRTTEKLIPRFLFHILTSSNFSSYLDNAISSSTINNLSESVLRPYLVPVPPLEIQQEIVGILDTFTELDTELAAELASRKSQYEFYRNHLLSFRSEEAEGVRWIPLGDICEYRKERSKSSIGAFMYVGVEDLLQDRQGVASDVRFVSSIGHDIFMPGDVLLGNIRPYLKKVWRADVEGRTNGDVLVVTPRQEMLTELNTSFLYYLLSSDDFFSYSVQTSKGAKMPRGDKQAIMRYEIPVPSIESQKRIAKALASFEQLIQDLEIGLPAERAARKKQYEYYRSQLLTFKALGVA